MVLRLVRPSGMFEKQEKANWYSPRMYTCHRCVWYSCDAVPQDKRFFIAEREWQLLRMIATPPAML